MKRFRKLLLTVLPVFVLFVMCTQGMQAKAASAPKKNSFDASFSPSTKNITVAISKKYDKYEVGLYNAKRKLIKTEECFTAAFFDVKLNKLYYYRIRGLGYDSLTRTYVPTTKWSAYKAIWTPKNGAVKASLASRKSTAVIFKVPKISGVKSYTLYMSTTSSTKGYKKVGTIRPGKTVKVSRFNNATLQYYKNYYYKIVPNLKKKAAAVAPYSNGFKITKTYY